MNADIKTDVPIDELETQPLVAIIILNYNGFKDTIECLDSLQNIDYQNYRIVVVENGSSNDSFSILNAKFPDIELIRSEANLGFAGGCNLGMKKASGLNPAYYLLLNNDTIVERSFLTELVNARLKQQNAGILSPFEYSYSERNKLMFSGGSMSILRGPLYPVPASKIDPVESLPYKTALLGGSCMMIKREVIEQIGTLDEKYFLYFEDADFCLRASRAKWDLIMVPKSSIWHKGNASHGEKLGDVMAYYLSRNQLYYVSKNYTSFFAKTLFLSNFYFEKIIAFAKWTIKWKKNLIRCSFKGIVDFYLGKMGKGRF